MPDKIDLTKVQKLLDSNVTGYRIEKMSGVTRMTISSYRTGKRNIMNLSVQIARKLEKTYDILKEKGEL